MKHILLSTMILLAVNSFAKEGTGIGGSQLSDGGTGIGGSDIQHQTISNYDWCNDGMSIISKYQRKGANAQSEGESILALTNYYKGLQLALQKGNTQNQSRESSLTFRAIERSLVLAEIMGVVDVIANDTYASSISSSQLESQVLFMKWLYDYILEVSEELDQTFIEQYLVLSGTCSNCSNYNRDHSIRTIDNNIVKFAKKQIVDYTNTFFNAKIAASKNNYNTVDLLEGLKNLLIYSSMDLDRDNMFGAALSCQSQKLLDLSEEISDYLMVRNGATKDQRKITVFLLGIDSVMREITQTCGDL